MISVRSSQRPILPTTTAALPSPRGLEVAVCLIQPLHYVVGCFVLVPLARIERRTVGRTQRVPLANDRITLAARDVRGLALKHIQVALLAGQAVEDGQRVEELRLHPPHLAGVGDRAAGLPVGVK